MEAVGVTDLGEKSMADWAGDAERCRPVYARDASKAGCPISGGPDRPLADLTQDT